MSTTEVVNVGHCPFCGSSEDHRWAAFWQTSPTRAPVQGECERTESATPQAIRING